MVTAEVERKIDRFTTRIGKIEEYVKKWEEEYKLKTISQTMERLFDNFNELQMNISCIANIEQLKKYELNCHEVTYDFLCFVENEVNPDFYIFLTNKIASFSKVVKHLSLYCTKIEKKYNIELYSEKLFETSPNSAPKKKSVKRK